MCQVASDVSERSRAQLKTKSNNLLPPRRLSPVRPAVLPQPQWVLKPVRGGRKAKFLKTWSSNAYIPYDRGRRYSSCSCHEPCRKFINVFDGTDHHAIYPHRCIVYAYLISNI